MKKFLFALILIALPLVGNAQEHMKFMGIPIDGTPAQFGQKLVTQKGMTDIGRNCYVGKFFGIENCCVAVVGVDNNIRTVSVYFPESKDWTSISARYNQLKNSLTSKYGEPYNVTEYFDSKYVDDDPSRFYELIFDRCHYETSWVMTQGEIQLKMVNLKGDNSSDSQHVALFYIDYANFNKAEAAKSDDL